MKCSCTVGKIWVHLLLLNQLLILSWIPGPLNMGLKLDSKFDVIDKVHRYKDIYLLCRPDLSTSLHITVISDFYLRHLILKVWIFDFCLDHLIQNLDFEVRLATWQSCYITQIVANLGSLTYNPMLQSLIQSLFYSMWSWSGLLFENHHDFLIIIYSNSCIYIKRFYCILLLPCSL